MDIKAALLGQLPQADPERLDIERNADTVSVTYRDWHEGKERRRCIAMPIDGQSDAELVEELASAAELAWFPAHTNEQLQELLDATQVGGAAMLAPVLGPRAAK